MAQDFLADGSLATHNHVLRRLVIPFGGADLTIERIVVADSRVPKLLTIHRRGLEQKDPRWDAVEEALGLRLPRSYKSLVDLFGASSWGDFLHIYSPFDDRLNLQTRSKVILDADRDSRQSFPSHYPFALHPEPGGLLPWAGTDNGDTLYFITMGPPDDWAIVIKGPRAPEMEVSFLPASLLVHHIAVGSFRSTILTPL